MSETKLLATLKVVIDTDENEHRIGEIHGGFDEIALSEAIQSISNPHEIMETLSYMQWQLWTIMKGLPVDQRIKMQPSQYERQKFNLESTNISPIVQAIEFGRGAPAKHSSELACGGNCGDNYCDEYGCVNAKPFADANILPSRLPRNLDRLEDK